MTNHTPSPGGCLRLERALLGLGAVIGTTPSSGYLAHPCRLLHCRAYAAESHRCDPGRPNACHNCPGAPFTIEPDLQKDPNS